MQRIGIVMIGDEVKTGFRIALGGAQSTSVSTPTWLPMPRLSAMGFPSLPSAATTR